MLSSNKIQPTNLVGKDETSSALNESYTINAEASRRTDGFPVENIAVIVKPIMAQPIVTQPAIFKAIRLLEPISVLGDPIRSGDFWLWIDSNTNTVFFSLAVPQLRYFSLTVQRESQGGTIKVTGGDAVLEISLSATEDKILSERYHKSWADKLIANGHPSRNWKFQPLTLSNIQASLSLNSNHINKTPQVTTNRDLGTATFLISLSETGIQIWKNALEQRQGKSIPGICKLSFDFYALFQKRIGVKKQGLSIDLGTLLADFGPEVIINVQLQLSAKAIFKVEWHNSLESVVVNWRPNNGAPPGSQVFEQNSLPLEILLTSNDLNALEVEWTAKISFKNPQWPPIAETGKLSFINNDFSHILKPHAWLQDFTLIVSMLDQEGNIIPNSDNAVDLNNRVLGQLNFIAPYLSKPLMEAFETSSQQIITIPFPVRSGESPKLLLSIITQRKGKSGHLTRTLRLDENLIAVEIDFNAHIKITTNQDRVTEDSLASEMLGVLALMQ